MLKKSYLFFIILSLIFTTPSFSTDSEDETSAPIEDDRGTPVPSPLQVDLPSSEETPVETKKISKKSRRWCCLQREDDD
jgi:hypothetical protein